MEEAVGGTARSRDCVHGQGADAGEQRKHDDYQSTGTLTVGLFTSMRAFIVFYLHLLQLQITTATVIDRDDLEGNANGFAIHVRLIHTSILTNL